MKETRYINEPLEYHFQFVDKDKTSFMFYNCNLPDVKSDNKPYPIHTYSKYTTLYDGNLFEGMYLLEHGFAIRIFNALNKTEIEYFSNNLSNNYIDTFNTIEISTTIDLHNRLLKPDYPKLEKLISKVKNLAPFL